MTIQSDVKSSYGGFCVEIEKVLEAAGLRRFVAKNLTACLGTIKQFNGLYASSKEESLNPFIEINFPEFKKIERYEDEFWISPNPRKQLKKRYIRDAILISHPLHSGQQAFTCGCWV